MEVHFEITRRFQKDLESLPVADQTRVAATINKYAASFDPEKGDPTGHIYQPHKVFLPQKMESSLYVLRVNRDVRVILTLDDDPLFNRKLVTLMRAVRHNKLDRAFRSIAESLYQNWQISQES